MLAQLRSTVPSNLPHECFTPLAGIIGLMEILRAEGATFTPAETADIYKDVYLSATRLHRTLRNYLMILDYQGKPDEPTALPPVLSADKIEESIRAGIEEVLKSNDRLDDLTLKVKPCALSIKPADLTRIVEELVDNACKFSRQGTPVSVELNGEGRLIVTDKGRGMTPAEISHIGAFHQFDRQKHEQQGLGLGLVLVQRLTAQCQAEFSVKSQSGEGTEVQVAFPVASV
jgi:signal transduction histidine kinase